MSAPKLSENFIPLGFGAKSVPQPPFTGMEWYGGHIERHGDLYHCGRRYAAPPSITAPRHSALDSHKKAPNFSVR